jgi:hypothetical protein
MAPKTKEEIRAAVIEILIQWRPGIVLNFDYLHSRVVEIAKQRGLKHDHNGGLVDPWQQSYHGVEILREDWKLCVHDTVWDFIVEGVLRPGSANGQHLQFPYLHVTDYGREALKGPQTPHDPTGYFKHFDSQVPNVDPVIKSYLAESVNTLRANCLLSSTITLGCASEKAFLLVAEKFSLGLELVEKHKFDREFEQARTIKSQHKVFVTWYEKRLQQRIKSGKGSDFENELSSALQFVFGFFRVMRNDAGHPIETKFSKPLEAQNLQLFPHYLKLLYELMDWMDANKPL